MDPRIPAAVADAGLTVVSQRDVVFRAGEPPLIGLWVCARSGSRVALPSLTVRGAGGTWTRPYLEIRRELELDP